MRAITNRLYMYTSKMASNAFKELKSRDMSLYKLALGWVFSEYLGFSWQCSFNQTFHIN
jgi:hypothetical protein